MASSITWKDKLDSLCPFGGLGPYCVEAGALRIITYCSSAPFIVVGCATVR